MVRQSYQEHSFQMLFCSDETFVRAWFTFIDLQQLDSGMLCPACGPSPKVIIVDGISLGTHSSKLHPSICPPTFTDDASEHIESISSYQARHLPAIPQPAMCALVMKLLDDIAGKRDTEPISQSSMTAFTVQYSALAIFITLLAVGGHESPYYPL